MNRVPWVPRAIVPLRRYARRLRQRDTYAVYLMLEGAVAFFLAISITFNLVYQVEVAHLNPLQLVLVGTMMEGTALVCQLPTGVFADLVSRKIAVVVGVFCLGVGGVVQGAFPVFLPIVLSSGISGLGYTFITGAEEAWLAEGVSEEHIGHAFLRGAEVGQIGSLAGIGGAVALGTVHLRVPLLVGGVLLMLFAVALLLLMREAHGRARPTDGLQEGEVRFAQAWRGLWKTLATGFGAVRSSALLAATIGASLFFGLFSEGFDRLNVDHFLRDTHLPPLGAHPDVFWFGLINAGTLVLGLVAVEVVRRRVDTRDNARVARAMVVVNGLLVLCVFGFALAGSFALALACFWAAAALRKIDGPLYTGWLTRHIPASVRATVLSFDGQVDALGQIAGGPIVGAVGLALSVRAALLATGTLLLPALPLLAYAGRRSPRAASPIIATPAEVTEAPVLPPREAAPTE